VADHGFGWLPDKPDPRDQLLEHPPTALLEAAAAPPSVDLRSKMPKIFDQGALGSCVANAATAVCQYVERKDGQKDWDRLSRLEVYYHARVFIGTVDQDSGAMIRDGFKVLAQRGAAREKFWPYDIAKFAIEPPASLARSARYHRAIEYRAVQASFADMWATLAAGFPFAFGFDVYESFQGDALANGTDPVYNPRLGEAVLGGHAVTCVGYDPARSLWIIRNSWGKGWGEAGHFYVPRAWMPRNAFDLWTITKAT
jgi:C1A family cysteine protease